MSSPPSRYDDDDDVEVLEKSTGSNETPDDGDKILDDGNLLIQKELENRKKDREYSRSQTRERRAGKEVNLTGVDWSGFPAAAHKKAGKKGRQVRSKYSDETESLNGSVKSNISNKVRNNKEPRRGVRRCHSHGDPPSSVSTAPSTGETRGRESTGSGQRFRGNRRQNGGVRSTSPTRRRLGDDISRHSISSSPGDINGESRNVPRRRRSLDPSSKNNASSTGGPEKSRSMPRRRRSLDPSSRVGAGNGEGGAMPRRRSLDPTNNTNDDSPRSRSNHGMKDGNSPKRGTRRSLAAASSTTLDVGNKKVVYRVKRVSGEQARVFEGGPLTPGSTDGRRGGAINRPTLLMQKASSIRW